MKKLTKREKLLIYILFCFLIAMAGIYLLLLPGYERYSEVRDQYLEAEGTQLSMEAAIGSIPDLKTSIEMAGDKASVLEAPYSMPLSNEALDQMLTLLCLNYQLSPRVLSIQGNGLSSLSRFEETIGEEADNLKMTGSGTSDTGNTPVSVLVGEVEMELSGTVNNFYRLMDAVASRPDMVITYFDLNPVSNGEDENSDSGTTTTSIRYSNWLESLDDGMASIDVRFNVYMVDKETN